ncbi:MAG: hypothetical protein JXA91_04155 [Candidatus Thermoplasmatota archaeon]|nr:hypothetical protein [Candidatus Thermoplasmatota archaeon]
MTEKIITIFVVALFFLGAVSIIDAGEQPNANNTYVKNINFSKPTIETNGEFITISIDETENIHFEPGMPIMPVHQLVVDFPLGTTIEKITLNCNNAISQSISAKIKPASSALTLDKSAEVESIVMDEGIYKSTNSYPTAWHSYNTFVGLTKDNQRKLIVSINIYPVRYFPLKDEINYIQNAELEIKYNSPAESIVEADVYDFLIITAPAYEKEMKRLSNHKNNLGIRTKVTLLGEISGQGRDEQEKIKYYIKNAIEDWGIEYVLLVGGYRSFLGLDNPKLQFPIRHVYLNTGGGDDTDYPSDIYYSDIYYYNPVTGKEFCDWDSNDNGRFGEWDWYGYDELDLVPDVYLGRLACRHEKEAKTMVDKIINYENSDNSKEDWFKTVLTATGDDFADFPEWNMPWDVSVLQNGEYTIHAQSKNKQGTTGPENEVTVYVDNTLQSVVTFSEQDHITTGLSYPFPPVAEITVPSEGDILGTTDVYANKPRGAYDGDRWTSIEYLEGIMYIKGKSYDPQPNPDGSFTELHVWVTDSGGQQVPNADWTIEDVEVWFEGEPVMKKTLEYFPDDFQEVNLWTSTGDFNDIDDVLLALNEGCGFAYFEGHANPMVWGNHYPGIPGGRNDATVDGLYQINQGGITPPFFPLDQLKNGNKLPITVLSGCHPLAIDCSLLRLLIDPIYNLYSAKSGSWAPECLGWWLTRLPEGGTIATMGPAAMGYGVSGSENTERYGGWLWPEFFRLYFEENIDILGETFTQALNNYITHFSPMGQSHTKTVEEMILLGDPTLKIGGHSSSASLDLREMSDLSQETEEKPGFILQKTEWLKTGVSSLDSAFSNYYQVTKNPLLDKKPESLTSNGNGNFLVGYARQEQTYTGPVWHSGFAYSRGGVVWNELLLPNGNDETVHQSVSYCGINNIAVGCQYNGVASDHDIILMGDMTDENTWEVRTYYNPQGTTAEYGKNGCVINGDYFDDSIQYISMMTCDYIYQNLVQVPVFSSSSSDYTTSLPGLENVFNLVGAVDHSSHYNFFGFEHASGAFLVRALHPQTPGDGLDLGFIGPFNGQNLDFGAYGGRAILVYEREDEIYSAYSSNGDTWLFNNLITTNGEKPEVVANKDDSFDCYFIRGAQIIKSHSINGIAWTEQGPVSDIDNLDTNDIFEVCNDAMVWSKTDGNLYAKIFGSTSSIFIDNVDVSSDKKTIIVTVINGGTTQMSNVDWQISLGPDNPVERIFGIPFLNGIILAGASTTGTINQLQPGDSIDLNSGKLLGFGSVIVTVNVGDVSFREDGFLLGRSLYLRHPL